MNLDVPNVNLSRDKAPDYIITYTGRKFRALDPQPEDIHIKDIAHGLAMNCRWAGQCTRFLSVAEHSVGVAERCPEHAALHGLLHDASEAYIGDVPRPFKEGISNYREIENNIMKVILDKYNIDYKSHAAVKVVDDRMLHTEVAVLIPECDWLEPKKIYTNHKVMCLSIEQAEQLFLMVFSKLFYK